MSLFPLDDKGRKALPIFKMVTGYFPKGLREVTRVCVANNVRYNPEKAPADIHWARGKSTDQLGSAFRHMLESEVDGLIFEAVSAVVTEATGIERVYVLAEAAWRLLAALELQIEQVEGCGAVETKMPGVIESGIQPKGANHGNSHQSCQQGQVHQENDGKQEGQLNQQRCFPWTKI